MGLLDKAKALKQIEEKKEILKEKEDTLEKKREAFTKKTTEEKQIEKGKPEKETKQKAYTAGKVIETDFDVLYKLVLEKNKVKISEVAKMFKIDKKKAEEWVQILDERDLVRIHYPAMGEPEIRKITKNEKIEE